MSIEVDLGSEKTETDAPESTKNSLSDRKEEERGATNFFQNGSWSGSWNGASRLVRIFHLQDY